MSPCKLFSNSATVQIIGRLGFHRICFSNIAYMLWIFRFFSIWPLAALHALGGVLGWLVWALSPRYRAQFRANALQAGLPFETVRPAVAEAGRFVAELPKLWMRPPSQSCLANVQVEGRSHADQAFAQGRGVIFFGAHCGSFELAPQALAELYGPVHGPMTAMYRPARKAWLAQLERMARNRADLTLVPASLSGIRLMHKALKANRAVGLLTDQVPPEGLGIWAPFFGRPAYTMTLAARLALQSGAALLPVSCQRLPHGRGYFLKIWPAVAGLETHEKSGMLHAVTLINQAVEAIVLSQPGQYLWGYARYKTPRKEAL
jgi:KDO2-lipid IV(A) lauroyltransferase